MSSKREGNSRFLVGKGTIKEMEIRSRRSKICLLLFWLTMESELDISPENNYIVCKVNFPSREVM